MLNDEQSNSQKYYKDIFIAWFQNVIRIARKGEI